MTISFFILTGIGLILVLLGIIGLVLPILPGPLFLFVGLVFGAWAEGFTEVGGLTIVFLALLMTFALLIDFLASALGTRVSGASSRAAWGALLGATLGLFWGLPGILLGPFIGAFLGELSVHDRLGHASRAGLGAWLGFVLGTAAKVALGFAMIGLFIAARCL